MIPLAFFPVLLLGRSSESMLWGLVCAPFCRAPYYQFFLLIIFFVSVFCIFGFFSPTTLVKNENRLFYDATSRERHSNQLIKKDRQTSKAHR